MLAHEVFHFFERESGVGLGGNGQRFVHGKIIF
jgi:hypothetical protein